MLLPPGNPYNKVRGKLTLTPEQALEMFNFIMNPDASGVILREYNMLDERLKNYSRRTIISNYVPATNPQTPEQQAHRDKMRIAVLHWQGLESWEKRVWNFRARKLKMSGYNLHNRGFLQGG